MSVCEQDRTDCYLCAPNEQLVFHKGDCGFAMAGLGPVVPGYSVVSTYGHYRSLSEMPKSELDSFVQYVEYIRNGLSEKYGSCLLTKHGRQPLCSIDDMNVAHCFHPHFLLFPNAPEISKGASECFKEVERFADFISAINFTAALDGYFFVSQHEKDFLIMSPTDSMPRQFARVLVSMVINQPELAGWRDCPQYETAIKNAAINIAAFEGGND